VTVQDMKKALDNPGLGIKVVDVREPDEYEIAKVAGVPLLPLSELHSRFTELDPNTQYYLHCKAGVRSMKALAARLLVVLGRPRPVWWIRVIASSLNRVSVRPLRARWCLMYPVVSSRVMGSRRARIALRWSSAASTPRVSFSRRAGWPIRRVAKQVVESRSKLVSMRWDSSCW